MIIKPTDDRAYGARNYSEILAEGLGYINDRRHGRIKSFKTPWLGFNRAGIKKARVFPLPVAAIPIKSRP
jgi:hypothetical protein